ncbi:MAG: peptidoglycan DD-metalloendopeptidase family protein [Geminicoccaceae bacterium]
MSGNAVRRGLVRSILALGLMGSAAIFWLSRGGEEPPPPARAAAPAVMPVTATVAALPAPPPSQPSPEPAVPPPVLAELELRRGDTLLDLLAEAGIGPAEAYQVVGSLREVADLRRLQIGQRVGVELDPAGAGEVVLARLVLPLDPSTEIHLVRGEDGGFAAESVARALRTRSVAVAAVIEDSFFAAGQGAGVPPQTLAEMIRLLSWDVDFQRDLHPGDRLEAVYRRLLDEAGRPVAEGDLDFVGLTTGERVIEAYRFAPDGGEADFYDREGRSVRKWLLRTVVDGARLSSGFGSRRHPILRYTRMHRGIDFAAPTGTPVLAAGSGVVEMAGRNRGYGNYVRLRHNASYATAYAHLSRYAPGLQRGRRVEQGEVIGYVGATGLATGPHLHYELLVDGRQVDPLGVDLVAGDPLRGAQLARFLARRDQIDRQRRAAVAPMADGRPPKQPPEAL